MEHVPYKIKLSVWLIIASLIITSIAMQPNIATLIVQGVNLVILIALRFVSRMEMRSKLIFKKEAANG
jgi:hypothetical protein